MKYILTVIVFSLFSLVSRAQQKDSLLGAPDPNKELLTLETACGQCKFGLAGNSCDLAVKVADKAYFVDGTDIDSHGDAHAKDGFCNSVRKAKVQGEIVNDRFRVTYFRLASR